MQSTGMVLHHWVLFAFLVGSKESLENQGNTMTRQENEKNELFANCFSRSVVDFALAITNKIATFTIP